MPLLHATTTFYEAGAHNGPHGLPAACVGAVVVNMQFPSGLTREDLKTWRGYLTNM